MPKSHLVNSGSEGITSSTELALSLGRCSSALLVLLVNLVHEGPLWLSIASTRHTEDVRIAIIACSNQGIVTQELAVLHKQTETA